MNVHGNKETAKLTFFAVVSAYEMPACMSRQFWNQHCVGNLGGLLAQAMGAFLAAFSMCSLCAGQGVMINFGVESR